MDSSSASARIAREFIRCNSCGADDARIRFRLAGQDFRHNTLHLDGQLVETESRETLVICNRCGLAYINPRISSLPGLTAYSEKEEIAYFEVTRGSRLGAYRTLLERVPTWLGRSPESLLDIGCGDGALLEVARKAGIARILGLEISASMIRLVQGRLGNEIVSGSDSSRIPDGSYDVIALINVLEHLPNPSQMLEEAQRIMKPGGILLIHVPNFGGLPARVMGSRWSQIEPYAHFYYFTDRTLRALLVQSGLTPIERFHLNIGKGIRAVAQDVTARLGIYLDNGLGIASRKRLEEI